MNFSSNRTIALLVTFFLVGILPIASLGQPAPVTNLDTGETFGTIQAAIDDFNTDSGDIIEVNSSTYDSSKEPGGHSWGSGKALIYVDKSVTIRSTEGAESTVIDGEGHRATIGITASNVKLKGLKVIGADLTPDSNTASGIAVSGEVSDVVIQNNIVTGNEYRGISLWKTQGSRIINNVISNNIRPASKNHSGFGIEVHRSDDNLIQDNEVVGNADEGITLLGSHANTIKNNVTSKNASEGIEIWTEVDWGTGDVVRVSRRNKVLSNEVVNNNGRGISIFGSSNNIVDGNFVSENSGHGIELEPCIDREVGELVRASTENEITDNEVLDNKATGIIVQGSSDNLVSSNHLSGNVEFGIRISLSHKPEDPFVSQAQENEIVNNTVENTIKSEVSWAGVGVIVHGANKNAVKDNEVADNDTGIMLLDRAKKNLVRNNLVNNNGHGINVHNISNNNLIKENEVTGNDGNGIDINGASLNVIQANTVSGNGDRGITLATRVDWETHEVMETARGNEILDNDILENKYFGIGIDGAKDNLISGNNIVNNGDLGVSISPRWREFRGEIIQSAEGNKIIGNTIEKTSPSSWNIAAGIRVEMVNKTKIRNNTISDNYFGLFVWTADNNIIEGNTVNQNRRAGILMGDDSDNNSVIRNEVFGTYVEVGESEIRGYGIACSSINRNSEDPLNENNVFSGNYVHDNAFGMLIGESKDSTIKNNRVKNNDSGVSTIFARLFRTDTTTWDFVTAYSNGGGIQVIGQNNAITGNTVTGNGFGIEIQGGNFPVQAENNIVKSNIVKGNSKGKVTLSVQRYEETTTSSGFEKKSLGASYLEAGHSIQSARAQSREKTKTIEVVKSGSFGLMLANASSNMVKGNTFRDNGENGITMGGFSFPDYGLSGQSNENDFQDNRVTVNDKGLIIGPYSRDNTFQTNQIDHNRTAGIIIEEATGNSFHRNSIENNENYGAKNEAPGTVLEATDNYWGKPSGPYHSTKNPDGEGNRVSDSIYFDPWLESSPFSEEGNLKAGWNMISPPGKPINKDPATALKDDIDPLVLFYDYTKTKGYTVYPEDTTATQLGWRQGSWIRTNQKTSIDMQVTAPADKATLQFNQPGWHMIGTPYTVDWSRVNFSDPIDFQTDGAGHVRLVSWDPTGEKYLNHYSDDSYVLSPWSGYWIYVESAPASLTVKETSSPASSLSKQTPLPQSVKRNKLDYPPKPPKYETNPTKPEVFAFPNPVTTADKVLFNITGKTEGIDKVKVKVFTPTGSLLWSGQAPGRTLTWNPEDLANGVYLYRSAVHLNGQWQKMDVAKLLVIK